MYNRVAVPVHHRSITAVEVAEINLGKAVFVLNPLDFVGTKRFGKIAFLIEKRVDVVDALRDLFGRMVDWFKPPLCMEFL